MVHQYVHIDSLSLFCKENVNKNTLPSSFENIILLEAIKLFFLLSIPLRIIFLWDFLEIRKRTLPNFYNIFKRNFSRYYCMHIHVLTCLIKLHNSMLVTHRAMINLTCRTVSSTSSDVLHLISINSNNYYYKQLSFEREANE